MKLWADWEQVDVNSVTPLMKVVTLNSQFYVKKLIELSMSSRKNGC